jgi:hypothetical protein
LRGSEAEKEYHVGLLTQGQHPFEQRDGLVLGARLPLEGRQGLLNGLCRSNTL